MPPDQAIMLTVKSIYLDNNATTRVADSVVEAMEPCWRVQFGNPSSLHRMGQAARHAIETAREQVAGLIGAQPREIVFTSGGTESDNLAILGTLAAYPKKRHIVTTAVEHPAVHGLCERWAKLGLDVTFVGVDSSGRLDLDAFERAVSERTALASVMHANNETGVFFPIKEVAEVTSARGVPLHVDAAQTVGKIDVDVASLGCDLMTLSAHKMHGPKGVGALYVGPRVRLRSQLVGGHQERDIRPGTENVAGIVGLGAAASLASSRLASGESHVAELRDRLERGILDRVHCARVIGDVSRRIPSTTNVAFESLSAEAILVGLSERGVCASSGSACASGSMEPSHVIQTMGLDERLAHGAVRFSLSWDSTIKEIDRALEIVPEVVTRLEAIN